MPLKFTRPIIFFDLETTGTSITRDRIVEISMIKIFPSGEEKVRTLRINPEMHIPEEATAVHHISDADVADKPTFKAIASQLAQSFQGCDIAGFNSNRFDIPVLAEEFARAGVDFDFSRPRFIDVQTIFHKKEQRTLSAAYQFYCHRNLDDAHSAQADTRATYEVLLAQLERYADLPNDVDGLAEFSTQKRTVDVAGRIVFNDKGVEVFNFGRYKDQPVAEVLKKDPGYYGWVLQGDFASDTKKALTRLKLKYGV